MSKSLLDTVGLFLGGYTPVNLFVDNYIDQWKAERDLGSLRKVDPEVSGKLSSIFCAADMYNSAEDRKDYELDEAKLRIAIQNILDGK